MWKFWERVLMWVCAPALPFVVYFIAANDRMTTGQQAADAFVSTGLVMIVCLSLYNLGAIFRAAKKLAGFARSLAVKFIGGTIAASGKFAADVREEAARR